MATREANISNYLQDEIWKIMHMVAELEVHPEDISSEIQPKRSNLRNNLKLQRAKRYECESGLDVADGGLDVADGDIEVDGHTEQDLKDAAGKLKKAADAFDEQEKLVRDIVNYIRSKGNDIDAEYGATFGKNRPSDFLFQSGVLSSLYGFFKSQLQTIIGDGEDLTKFALVSSVTTGVTRGLKESSFDYVHLTASLASKFIIDKYGGLVMQEGGMAKLVLNRSE